MGQVTKPIVETDFDVEIAVKMMKAHCFELNRTCREEHGDPTVAFDRWRTSFCSSRSFLSLSLQRFWTNVQKLHRRSYELCSLTSVTAQRERSMEGQRSRWRRIGGGRKIGGEIERGKEKERAERKSSEGTMKPTEEGVGWTTTVQLELTREKGKGK